MAQDPMTPIEYKIPISKAPKDGDILLGITTEGGTSVFQVSAYGKENWSDFYAIFTTADTDTGWSFNDSGIFSLTYISSPVYANGVLTFTIPKIYNFNNIIYIPSPDGFTNYG